jgi:O-antigen/teichoic acid export membrane protein
VSRARSNSLTTIAGISFQEFGDSNYLIQKPSLSERDIRTAFTIVFVLSATFTAALLLLRGAIANFFAQEGIETALSISCLNFLICPFSLTIAALSRRNLSVGALTRCNLAGSLVTALTSIALAIAGLSFLALVIGTVVGNATATACLLAVRRNLRIFRPCLEGYEEVVARHCQHHFRPSGSHRAGLRNYRFPLILLWRDPTGKVIVCAFRID